MLMRKVFEFHEKVIAEIETFGLYNFGYFIQLLPLERKASTS